MNRTFHELLDQIVSLLLGESLSSARWCTQSPTQLICCTFSDVDKNLASCMTMNIIASSQICRRASENTSNIQTCRVACILYTEYMYIQHVHIYIHTLPVRRCASAIINAYYKVIWIDYKNKIQRLQVCRIYFYWTQQWGTYAGGK